MKTITIKTQTELDALPDSFKEYTVIEIRGGAQFDPIVVKKAWDSSHVVARDSSHVEARGSSHVEAWGSSHVVARDSSHVVARDSSHVEAWDSSHVVAWDSSHVVARDSSHVVAWDSSHVVAWDSSHVVAWDSSHVVARDSSHVVARDSSHVEAWGFSHVVAWDSSHVVARDSSHVVAWGSSHVVARDSSHVVARDSSHVEAWGSSHVVARDSSHVEAWGSSHVVAWDSSHVVARDSVSVHAHSPFSIIELAAFAVCILIAKAKVKRESKTCTVVSPVQKKGNAGWLEREGVKAAKSVVRLFKRVSKEFQTQEGKPQETLWKVGSALEHPSWNPKGQECGAGKFHACSRAYFCDEFRSEVGDRYVAIEIATKDLHAWDGGDYPHKIAFRKGRVLFECDRFGEEIK